MLVLYVGIELKRILLLLVNDEGLNQIHTRIYTIVNVDTWENDQKLRDEL